MADKNQIRNTVHILQGNERLGLCRNGMFLAAEDLDRRIEPILTIEALGNGEAVLGMGRREDHDFIFFAEEKSGVPGCPRPRPLIVNATNRRTLAKLYGDVTAETLVGKKIQLYVDPHCKNPGGSGYVPGIRIRSMIPRETGNMNGQNMQNSHAPYGQPKSPAVPNIPMPAVAVQSPRMPQPPTENQPICADCGAPITAGGGMDLRGVLDNGMIAFNRPLCTPCQNRLMDEHCIPMNGGWKNGKRN